MITAASAADAYDLLVRSPRHAAKAFALVPTGEKSQDLAVELGYNRMAEMQEELLRICEAAQIPVIWATQVLENLAKEGVPSRAEVTDAAMAVRAECVMLNKGPFITEAVQLLDDVLTRMLAHQQKKTAQLRALHSWQSLFEG